MLKVLGLDHIVLRSARSDDLIAFYRDVLGCPVERESAPETGLVQLRAGSALIDIISIDGTLGRRGGRAPGREGRNMDHLCLALEEFDEAALRRHLERRGITIKEAGRRYGASGFGPSVYIEDPDGNTVELKGVRDAE